MGIKAAVIDLYWKVRNRRQHTVNCSPEKRKRRIADADNALYSAIDRFSNAIQHPSSEFRRKVKL